MPLPNPTVNVPRLTSRPPRHSRSASHSPVRQALDYDPLLSDLSPTRTLRIFADPHGNGQSTRGKHDSSVCYGFEGVSPSERALGTRAAQTCLAFRAWCRELESWQWPGTFDLPELARTKMRSGVDMEDVFMVPTPDGGEEEHWGSLPARTVRLYDHRIDDICRDLDTTDVEELKNYVLTAHQTSGGLADGSLDGIGQISDLRQLDDFTAIVTATILQALPFLSRLHMLLDSWTIRLSVLRQTPVYLRDLKYVRTDLNHGWAAIASSYPASRSAATFTSDTMHKLRSDIQRQVKHLAQRLDSLLDMLEGSSDTLPESWIEDFEDLEAAYVDWVVQAERRVIENEWRSTVAMNAESVRAARRESEAGLTGAPLERVPSDSYARENHASDAEALVSPSSRPTSVISLLAHDERESLEPYVDPHAGVHESATGEAEQAEAIRRSGKTQGLTEQDSPDRYSQYTPADTQDDEGEHSAHPPLAVGYSGAGNVHKALPPPPSAASLREHERSSGRIVARLRAGFANGEFEQPKSLRAQVKSPVRPFERATNAFTQLFRRDKTPEHVRSSSDHSNSSRGVSRTSESRQSGEVRPPTVFKEELISNTSDHGHQRTLYSPRRESKRASRRMSGGSQHLEDGDRTQDIGDAHISTGSEAQIRSEDMLQRLRPLYTPEEDSEGEERQIGMVDRPQPETYKPTRPEPGSRSQTSGHHADFEYPADWPLASPPATVPPSPAKDGGASSSHPDEGAYHSEDDFSLGPVVNRPPTSSLHDDKVAHDARVNGGAEIKTPIPLRTNDFDRLFVHNFPSVSDVDNNVVDASVKPRSSESKRRKRVREPVVGEDMLHDTFSLRSREAEDRRASMSSLGNWEDHAGEIGIYELRPPASVTTRSVKDDTWEAASGEALDIGPQWVPSKADDTGETPQQKLRPKSMPARPSGSLKLNIPGLNDDLVVVNPAADAENARPGHISRASITSVDSIPRSKVKTIELSRRRSDVLPSPRSAMQSPIMDAPESVSPMDPNDGPNVMPYKGLVTFPSPPPGRGSLAMSPVSPIIEHDAGRVRMPTSRFAILPSSPARDSTGESPNSPYAESEHSFASPHLQSAKRRGPGAAVKTMTPTIDAGDVFDRHVSEVLERLPSQSIKFKSRPGAETPDASIRASETRWHRDARLKATRTGPRMQGNITIAPAEASPRKTESEIKLYHLTQADSDQPIKLFVRIVGEGERVMVRVGGGWQDLADFLRQFATHHGSRTASGSALEVVTTDSAPGSRKVSSSAVTGSKTSGHGPTMDNTPTRALAARPVSRTDARRDDEDWLRQPQPAFDMGDESRPATADGTPDTFSLSPVATRPGTADSAKRPASAAGRRGVLDEHKSRWVDDMIEKARMSAEKSKEERAKYFGDLSRAGGTRRVVFRATDGPDEKRKN